MYESQLYIKIIHEETARAGEIFRYYCNRVVPKYKSWNEENKEEWRR